MNFIRKQLSDNHILTGSFFFRILSVLLFNEKLLFSGKFYIFVHFSVAVLILLTSWSILVLFQGFADPRWPPFENVTYVSHHVMSLAHVWGRKRKYLLNKY